GAQFRNIRPEIHRDIGRVRNVATEPMHPVVGWRTITRTGKPTLITHQQFVGHRAGIHFRDRRFHVRPRERHRGNERTKQNCDELRLASVAVAVMSRLVAGAVAQAAVKFTLPPPSVVTLVAPRKYFPSGMLVASQAGVAKNSSRYAAPAWLFREPCTSRELK